jgi:spermidine dehydrogenase
MNKNDRTLGMNRFITRRDFINGVSAALAGSMLSPLRALTSEEEYSPERSSDYYPPTRTGMRGSHPGSFEVAHKIRDQRGWDLSTAIDARETYDLVIVGGGISGLSAAHFFLKDAGRDAKVLVLDNHDDFGGALWF